MKDYMDGTEMIGQGRVGVNKGTTRPPSPACETVRGALLRNFTNDEAVNLALARHPGCCMNPRHVSSIRTDLRKLHPSLPTSRGAGRQAAARAIAAAGDASSNLAANVADAVVEKTSLPGRSRRARQS
jgi:hypothetical protein